MITNTYGACDGEKAKSKPNPYNIDTLLNAGIPNSSLSAIANMVPQLASKLQKPKTPPLFHDILTSNDRKSLPQKISVIRPVPIHNGSMPILKNMLSPGWASAQIYQQNVELMRHYQQLQQFQRNMVLGAAGIPQPPPVLGRMDFCEMRQQGAVDLRRQSADVVVEKVVPMKKRKWMRNMGMPVLERQDQVHKSCPKSHPPQDPSTPKIITSLRQKLHETEQRAVRVETKLLTERAEMKKKQEELDMMRVEFMKNVEKNGKELEEKEEEIKKCFETLNSESKKFMDEREEYQKEWKQRTSEFWSLQVRITTAQEKIEELDKTLAEKREEYQKTIDADESRVEHAKLQKDRMLGQVADLEGILERKKLEIQEEVNRKRKESAQLTEQIQCLRAKARKAEKRRLVAEGMWQEASSKKKPLEASTNSRMFN